MKVKNTCKRLGNFSFGLSGVFLVASLIFNLFLSNQVSAANKVDVCHWTAAGKYVLINVDASVIEKWMNQGHGEHADDIWADFTTGDGLFVPGQGEMDILSNGCEVPDLPTQPLVRTESVGRNCQPTASLCRPSPTKKSKLPTDTNTPTEPAVDHKTDVCHWTEAGKYVLINVDTASIEKWKKQGHGYHEQDIWAAFTTGDGVLVPGQGDLNILNNGCEIPATATHTPVPPTPTDTSIPPTPTDTVVLTDTPTPTSTDTPTATSTGTATSTSTDAATPTSTNTATPTTTNTATPTETPVGRKIDICHWTGADKYVCFTADISSVEKWKTQGHGNHPNDIWPDFTTDDGEFVAGRGNIAILNNGCVVPQNPTHTPTLSTPTATASPPTATRTPARPTTTRTPLPPTSTKTSTAPTLTSTLLPPTATSTTVLPTRTEPAEPSTSTFTPEPPTATFTPGLPTSEGTLLPSEQVEISLLLSSTDTPTFTLTPFIVVSPEAVESNVIFPVTGVDQGAFSRELPGVFTNMCLGFLGLGLVLKGIARRFEE